MSDTDTAGTDQLKTEQEEQKASERREFLKRGAVALGAGWLALGGVRELLAAPGGAGSHARAGVAFQPSVVEQQRANQEKLDRAIRQMERHVRKTPDGTFELKAKTPQDVGLDQEAFDQLRSSLEQGNEAVRSGRVRAAEVRATTGRPEDDAPGRSGSTPANP